jgi:hypothetical protein
VTFGLAIVAVTAVRWLVMRAIAVRLIIGAVRTLVEQGRTVVPEARR